MVYMHSKLLTLDLNNIFLNLYFYFFLLFLTLSYVLWVVTQCHDQVAFFVASRNETEA
jgi:hypothetical protein